MNGVKLFVRGLLLDNSSTWEIRWDNSWAGGTISGCIRSTCGSNDNFKTLRGPHLRSSRSACGPRAALLTPPTSMYVCPVCRALQTLEILCQCQSNSWKLSNINPNFVWLLWQYCLYFKYNLPRPISIRNNDSLIVNFLRLSCVWVFC